MAALTPSQRLLLETIRQHSGEWNWYKLGRACLHQLESPADFTLEPLVQAGLVETRDSENEPLPRLVITPRGEEALERNGADEAATTGRLREPGRKSVAI
jgi:hypothetical protein